jgi:hypothetical protein
MLPKYYLSYTFWAPFYLFATFFIAYVLGRRGISFTASVYKLIMLLVLLFVLQIIIAQLGRKDSKKRKRKRMVSVPQEYYDRLYGTGNY